MNHASAVGGLTGVIPCPRSCCPTEPTTLAPSRASRAIRPGGMNTVAGEGLGGKAMIPEIVWTQESNGLGCKFPYGRPNNYGYRSLWINNRLQFVHRAVYEDKFGPVKPGHCIDHKCRTPGCANIDHLELVTHRENTLRGVGPSAMNAKKTHCVNGHQFTPENTRFSTRSQRTHAQRVCRKCKALTSKKRYRAAHSRAAAPIKDEP